jgi:hypothetical protein
VTWVEAEGCGVVGGDGRRLLDLSGGFGVAALGHRNPEVGEAIVDQAARCVHALGDLAEADVTAELRRQLGLGRHHVIAALVVLERVPALLTASSKQMNGSNGLAGTEQGSCAPSRATPSVPTSRE